MFEKITINTQNKNDGNNPIDIGCLVECMVFYGKTYVIANQGVLKQLIKYFGVGGLVELINLDALEVVYTEKILGVITGNYGNQDV